MGARRWACAALAAGLALGGFAGCASAPRSVSQTLDVEAVTPLGAPLAGARCVLRQGAAEWTVQPPARTTVITSGEDLLVRCETADGAALGEARLPARVHGGRGVRTLVGAGIGGTLGAALGQNEDRKDKDGLCCSGLGRLTYGLRGLGLGAAAGALSADPSHAYADKVRVVMAPAAPPAAAR